MPDLDIRTLALAVSLFFLVLAIYLGHFRLSRPALPGMGSYALGSLAGAVGMVLLMARGHTPDLVSVVLANLLLGLMSQLVFLGLARFLGRRQRAWPHVLAACLLAAGLVYFRYVQPSVEARVIIMCLMNGGYTLAQAAMLWRFSVPVVGNRSCPLFLMTLAMGLIFAFRGVYTAFFEQRMPDLMEAGLVHGLSFLSFILGGFLVMVGLVFLAVQRLELEARRAREQVRQLSGLLPICSSCKRIRDDQGYWHQVEAYVRDHSEADFTHGICPDCMRQLYPEVAQKVLAKYPSQQQESGGEGGA